MAAAGRKRNPRGLCPSHENTRSRVSWPSACGIAASQLRSTLRTSRERRRNTAGGSRRCGVRDSTSDRRDRLVNISSQWQTKSSCLERASPKWPALWDVNS